MLYVWIIAAAVAVISLINVAWVAPVYEASRLSLVGATLLSVAVVIAIDGVTAWLVNRLPKKWFNHKSSFFTVKAEEKKFYEKLKIRKWKDRIPELGALGGFSKSEIADPYNNEYVEKFLTEIAYGEIVHIFSILFGFFILFLFPRYVWSIGIPVAIVNALMNLPSICILRYNAHKLEVLFKSNEKRAARQAKKREEEATRVSEPLAEAATAEATESV